MKLFLTLIALCTITPSFTDAFTSSCSFRVQKSWLLPTTTIGTATTSPLNMFSGGGDGAIKEDMDPDQVKAIEDAAKAMGMTVAEYQLGVNARMRYEKTIGDLRFSGGDDDIGVTVDGRSPPSHLEIKITDAGKAKGQEAISSGLAAALKKTSSEARSQRLAAMSDMMKFIQESMK